MSILYERIKMRREQINMSQEDLSTKLGYKSRSSINKIEKGKSDIPQSKIKSFAEALGVSESWLIGYGNTLAPEMDSESRFVVEKQRGVLIPVLGRVQAGKPIEAVVDIIGYEEISEDMAKNGNHFGLQIHGVSMEPKMSEGDVVIVKQQDYVESGQIAIVIVNNSDATVKKVIKHPDGISLISFNPVYTPIYYTDKEVTDIPVRICGRVVELRAKF